MVVLVRVLEPRCSNVEWLGKLSRQRKVYPWVCAPPNPVASGISDLELQSRKRLKAPPNTRSDAAVGGALVFVVVCFPWVVVESLILGSGWYIYRSR